MTWSPFFKLVTPGPVSTTTPAPSCPRMAGNRPSGSAPDNVYSSVWQIPVALISTSTSPARGPSSSTVSMLSGAFALRAMAARTFMAASLVRVRRRCCEVADPGASRKVPGALPRTPPEGAALWTAAKGIALGTLHLGWVWGRAPTPLEPAARLAPAPTPKRMDRKGTTFAGVQGQSPCPGSGAAPGPTPTESQNCDVIWHFPLGATRE